MWSSANDKEFIKQFRNKLNINSHQFLIMCEAIDHYFSEIKDMSNF